MSLAVQLTTDMKPQNVPSQGADPSDSEGSGDFSSVIDDVSTESSGESFSESDNPGNQADTENDGNSDIQDGKSDPSNGKGLPHEAREIESEVQSSSEEFLESFVSSAEGDSNLDLIDQIFNTEIKPKAQESDNSEVSAEAKNSIKPSMPPASELLLQPEPESGEVSGEELLAGDQPGIANPSIALEVDRRRIGLGSIKENIASRAPLSGEVPTGPLNNANLGQPSQGQDSRAFNTLGLSSTETGEPEKLDLQKSLLGSTEPRTGEEISRKIDIEAIMKDWIPTTVKETGASSLSGSGSQLSVAPSLTTPLGAAQTLANSSQTSSMPGTPQLLTLGTAVSEEAWADDFSVRIRTLVSGNVQQATLNLKPAELGAIEVNLSTDGNETKAQFSVQNAVVREVLESSMPRLREIFEESGLSLTDTDVRDQSDSQQASEQGDDNGQGTQSSSADNRIPHSEGVDPSQSDEILARWDGDQLAGGVDTFI